MAKTSPTQRSLAHLRSQGYLAAKTEKWNPFARISQDLFGFIDVVGLHASHPGVLAVQTTTASNASKRRDKILSLSAARVWLQCGNRIVVHAWAKRGAAGKRKLWSLVEYEIILEDFV